MFKAVPICDEPLDTNISPNDCGGALQEVFGRVLEALTMEQLDDNHVFRISHADPARRMPQGASES